MDSELLICKSQSFVSSLFLLGFLFLEGSSVVFLFLLLGIFQVDGIIWAELLFCGEGGIIKNRRAMARMGTQIVWRLSVG